MKVNAYFDGACEPINPGGMMGIGAYAELIAEHYMGQKKGEFNHGQIIFTDSRAVPKHPDNSNNVAEYLAFISILEFFIKEDLSNRAGNQYKDAQITIYGDSMLVIMQMKGAWRIKKGKYLSYAQKAKKLLEKFKYVTLEWVPRDKNSACDNLSKMPMREAGCEFKLQKNN